MSTREQGRERLETGVICTKVMQETDDGFETSPGKMGEDRNRALNVRQVINTRDENLGFMETA